MSAAALFAMLLWSGAPGCERTGLVPMPAAAQKVDERALLDAACGRECVVECTKDQEAAEEPPLSLVAHYEGSFRCPGKLESVVSLFPCGDAMGMHSVAGTVVLVRAAQPAGRARRGARWEKAGTIEYTVLNEGCKVARVGDRDAVVCMSFWGPLQGISGESLCVVRGSDDFGMQCASAAQDNCGTGADGALSAEVDSWSVGAAAADGTVPVSFTVKVAECDTGTHERKVEGVVLIDAKGPRLSPETAARFKKAGIVTE